MIRKLWKQTFLLMLIPALLCGLPVQQHEAGFFDTLRKYILPHKKLREYDRFFSPLIYIPYREQLQICVAEALSREPELVLKLEEPDTCLLRDARTLLDLSQEVLPAHPTNHRDWHQRWIRQLRHLIASKELLTKKYDKATEGVKHLLDRICLWTFSEAHFFDRFSDLLQLELKLEYPTNDLTTALLPKVLNKAWKKVSLHGSVSGFKKLSAAPGEAVQDPHYGGIRPTCLFHVGTTHFIYTPRVIQEFATDELTIYPEYLRYLSALSFQGKRHLYINLMNRKERKEQTLSNKIETLELQEKAIHVITLDHNSSFYRQNRNLRGSQAFKTAFLQHLFAPQVKSYYYWSKSLDSTLWQQECQQIIEKIHADYFQNRQELSISDRKAFIDITYIALIRSLLIKFACDHANITCKHSMDRGPQLTSLLFADEVLRTDGAWSPGNVKKFLALVLAPPVLSHNRPAAERHINRISNALKYLDPNDAERRSQRDR